MEWHPYAKLFPLLPDDRLHELAEDIRQHGLRQRIIVDDQERIIDGRNRYRACQMAGVEPELEPFVGTDEEVLRLVISLNLHRRHLKESQRAMIAAEAVSTSHGGNRKQEQGANLHLESGENVSVSKAAEALGVSPRSVKSASKVQSKGTPELQNAVIDGQIPVSRAAKLADLPPEQQVAEVEAAKAPKPKKPKVDKPAEPEPEPQPKVFDGQAAGARLRSILRTELDKWPDSERHRAAHFIREILEKEFNL